MVALVKTAIDAASTGYAQLSKTTKEAGEAIEASITAVAARVGPAAAKRS
jgi:hypothetical protein